MKPANPTVFIALLVWTAFIPLIVWVPRPYLFELVNALAVSFAIGVFVAWAPAAIDRLWRKHQLNGGDYLILGVTIASFFSAGQLIWRWIWRALNKPDPMIDHWLLAWFIYCFATGLALHLTARDAVEGRIPTRNWVILGLAAAAAVFLTLLTIIFIGPSGANGSSATNGH